MRILATSGFRNLIGMLLMVVVGNNVAIAQAPQELNLDSNHGAQLKRVFVNLTGDPRFTRRLWTLLDFEFEDAHLLHANTPAEADATVNGDLHAQVRKLSLGLGVVRLQVTANGQRENLDSCASLSTDENSNLFDRSASSTAATIRTKYPKASTIRFDSGSDMTRSEPFRDELARSLRESNFKIVDTSSSDITLRVDLMQEKVAIEENVVEYKIAVTAKYGTLFSNLSGNGVISATLVGHPPELCPKRVDDLDWLSRDNPLYTVARNIVKAFKKQRETDSKSTRTNKE
jgi:hypothetical protein